MLTLLQQFFGTELVNEVDELQRNSLLQVSYLLALYVPAIMFIRVCMYNCLALFSNYLTTIKKAARWC